MGPKPETYEDRRNQTRKKVEKAGRVIFNGSQGIVDCIILDISEGGAKLQFPGRQVLPRTFTLQLHDGTVTECEVRWAKDSFFGVRFLDDDE
jgi:hypothetical protein